MKRSPARIALTGLAILMLVLLIGPFLVPIPPLENTQPVEALADADSQFIQIDDLQLHVKTRGTGEPTLLLLHGFASSVYTWHTTMEPLSQFGQVIAFDRPAFGLSERPLRWEGRNPYSPDAQIDYVIGLLDHFQVDQAVLVGNSAGGSIAMQVALAHPERVSALILVDPAVYNGGGAPAWTRPLLASPQMRRLGPLFVRQIEARGMELLSLAWHDPSRLPPEMEALYRKPLQVNDWDKALWEFTLASREANLSDKLQSFTLPVLVITGDDDRIVPTADSVRLAGELPNASLVVIENAGHVPHEERPEAFIEAVSAFLETLP